jgi:hypothetical protein
MNYGRIISKGNKKFKALSEEVQDKVWQSIGGPATDLMQKSVNAFASETKLTYGEAAGVILSTLMDRIYMGEGMEELTEEESINITGGHFFNSQMIIRYNDVIRKCNAITPNIFGELKSNDDMTWESINLMENHLKNILMPHYKSMNEITVMPMEEDEWGRKRFANTVTGSAYAMVDGILHVTTEEGEPEYPLKKDLKIIFLEVGCEAAMVGKSLWQVGSDSLANGKFMGKEIISDITKE